MNESEILKQIIERRRTVKPDKFSDKPIAEEQIWELLKAADWAPTHKYTEPWRFTVFSGEGLKKLGDFQAELFKEVTPAADFADSKYDKLQKKYLKCSHVISLGMKRDVKERIPRDEEIEALACAIQNIWLMATSLGIAGYWTSGSLNDQPRMKAFLGLDERDEIRGYFLLGYPAEPIPPGRRVMPLADKVKWLNS